MRERPAPARSPSRPDLLVVKVGGSCLDELEPAWWDALAAHVRDAERDTNLVVVHGWSRALGAATPDGQPEFVVDRHGFRSRYTTPAILDEIVRTTAPQRERIAGLLGDRGLRADAVDASDVALLWAEVRRNMWWVGDELVELANLVGPVRRVDDIRLDLLLAEADAVVVTPLARGEEWPADSIHDRGGQDADKSGSSPRASDGQRPMHDRGGLGADKSGSSGGGRGEPVEHRRVNTDADRAAAAIAGAGGADRLALVMDAEAVLADGEPVARAARGDLPALGEHAEGGMAKKLRAVEEAFARGVREVAIGRAPVPDLLAGRAGTLIVDDGVVEGDAPAAVAARRDRRG